MLLPLRSLRLTVRDTSETALYAAALNRSILGRFFLDACQMS